MKIYASHGISLGYKGYMIKAFFVNYYLHGAGVAIDTATGEIQYYQSVSEPWRVTMVDTGLDSMTGGSSASATGSVSASSRHGIWVMSFVGPPGRVEPQPLPARSMPDVLIA